MCLVPSDAKHIYLLSRFCMARSSSSVWTFLLLQQRAHEAVLMVMQCMSRGTAKGGMLTYLVGTTPSTAALMESPAFRRSSGLAVLIGASSSSISVMCMRLLAPKHCTYIE